MRPLLCPGVETFVSMLQSSKKAIAPNANVLAVIPTLGVSQAMNERQTKLFQELERNLQPVDVWSDLHISRRQAIADNKAYSDATISQLFEPLADRVECSMGLRRNGRDESLRVDRRFGPYR